MANLRLNLYSPQPLFQFPDTTVISEQPRETMEAGTSFNIHGHDTSRNGVHTATIRTGRHDYLFHGCRNSDSIDHSENDSYNNTRGIVFS